MDLLGIRKMLVKQSGRYDLVTTVGTTSWANNEDGPGGGADFYIKEGQKFLDRRLGFTKERGELSVSLATGAFSTTLFGVRAIQAVSLIDGEDDEMVYLGKESIQMLRSHFGSENGSLASVERGQPHSWAVGVLRDNVTSNTTTEALGTKLIVMPPADRSYTLSVEALMFSAGLAATTSVSYWTVQNPQVLVWAALFLLETSYRNRQGAQAYLEAIDEVLLALDNEVVEQEVVGTDQAKSIFRFIEPPRRG